MSDLTTQLQKNPMLLFNKIKNLTIPPSSRRINEINQLIQIADLGLIDSDGNTAFMVACELEWPDIAMAIFNTGRYKPEQVNKYGDSVLMVACFDNSLHDVARAIIKSGMYKPDQVNQTGDTALLLACTNDMPDVALALINTGQSKPEQAVDGYTALNYACQKNMSDVALALINTGQSKPEQIDETGKTALDYAKDNNMTEVIKLLQQKTEPELFNINQTCFDIISGDDVYIANYLKEDSRLVFVFYSDNINNSIRVGLDTEQFKKSMLEREHYIVYGCNQPDTMRPENIVKTKPYFDIKKLSGFGDLVLLESMDNILNIINLNYSFNVFIFKKSGTNLVTTVSDDILNQRTNAVSARHCQSGQTAVVYELNKNVVFGCNNEQPVSTGGKKKYNKRKYSKILNTKKLKNLKKKYTKKYNRCRM